MKKYASLILSGALVLSAFAPFQANAQEKETNEGTNYEQPASESGNIEDYQLSKSEAIQQEIDLKIIKKYVIVDSNGHIGFENVPPGQYKKYNLSGLQDHFDMLNQKVDNKQLIINDDLTITDISIQLFASYGKWTYHWWGYDRKFTKSQANAYVDEIEYVILGMGAGAVVTAPSVVVSGAFALSAGWYGLLAKRIEANNKGKNGVLVKIYWARTFDIVPL